MLITEEVDGVTYGSTAVPAEPVLHLQSRWALNRHRKDHRLYNIPCLWVHNLHRRACSSTTTSYTAPSYGLIMGVWGFVNTTSLSTCLGSIIRRIGPRKMLQLHLHLGHRLDALPFIELLYPRCWRDRR